MKKTAVVYPANAMTFRSIYRKLITELFTDEFFPDSDVFIMDYPGTGRNSHKFPTMYNIIQSAKNIYKKALDHSRENNTTLWVFTISIGTGIFSTILKDLDINDAPYAIVSMNGIMSIRKTVMQVTNGLLFFTYMSLSKLFNTAKNMAEFLSRNPDTRIAWFANTGDYVIDIRNVNISVNKWITNNPSHKDKIFLEVIPHVSSTKDTHNYYIFKFYQKRLLELENNNWKSVSKMENILHSLDITVKFENQKFYIG